MKTSIFSPYFSLYDLIIDKDNFWRQLNELVDFSFVYEELQNNYSDSMGRPAEDPIRMMKYMLIKSASKLSDVDLIRKTKTDMEIKYFLGYNPEETNFINSSSLTKFRRMILKDTSLLDLMISKTVEIALEQGVLNAKNKLIVDSTHTLSRYNHISAREDLLKRAKELRKAVSALDPSIKEKMPTKTELTGLLEDAIEYSSKLIDVIEKEGGFENCEEVNNRLSYLSEGIEDINSEKEYAKDKEARIGHKSADTNFFGYKSHIAMTPERIIVAATITSGKKHDGKQLQYLVEKSEEVGIKVEAVIGDGAYSERDNLEYTEEKGITLASKLSKSVTHGTRSKKDEFEFNKDAGMYVCKAGHMAIRKVKRGSQKDKNGINTKVELYFFDVEKCKVCPHKEGCYKEGAKTKSYSLKIKDPKHLEQMKYIESDEYKELYKECYKIEAKNAEIKHNYNYGAAQTSGLLGMNIQGATTFFLTNMKRIIKLME